MTDVATTSQATGLAGADMLSALEPVLPDSARVNADGELAVGGIALSRLAEVYGTPLQVFDEDALRSQVRRYLRGLRSRWPNSEVVFASKALPIVAMYKLADDEGISVDIAGGGELKLAEAAGVPGDRLYFHGNAKTTHELELALAYGVGTIIIDNEDEIDRLESLLTRPQNVLLRVKPGIEVDTHPSQATGGVRSKFGLHPDELPRLIERIRSLPLVRLDGLHVHLGSQVLDTKQFAVGLQEISRLGEFSAYDVGGGLGVQYTADMVAPSVESYLNAITETAHRMLPRGSKLLIEPGRSLVARSGVTVYRVVSVKEGTPKFVAIDGGMADQLDVALTGQRYEAVLANRVTEPWVEEVELVGRQCENGDLLVSGMRTPPARPGDVVVMASTGAYSYTLANNYNGALRPAIVFVSDGESRLVVRRESYEDLVRLHEPSVAYSEGKRTPLV